MKSLTKTFIAAATVAALSSQAYAATTMRPPANDSRDYTTYGIGAHPCRLVLRKMPGQVGDELMLAYIAGYVSALNKVSPSNGDLADHETGDSLTRMIKITCLAHKDWIFEDAILAVVGRIADRNDKNSKRDGDKLLEEFR